MYMRLVYARYKPKALSKIRDIYDKVIIPRLEKTEGCLCVCAIASEQDPEDGISLTLWESPENVKAYETSGQYKELLKHVMPYLVDTTEWHVELVKEMEIKYNPVKKEPSIETFRAASQMDQNLPSHDQESGSMHMRIISVLLKDDMLEVFKAIYDKDILPAFRKLHGCRFAFMTQSGEGENTVLCVSLWDSKKHAEDYEKSGLFKKFRKKTKHTFSEFYRWKMRLEGKYSMDSRPPEEMKEDTYRVVTGKSF